MRRDDYALEVRLGDKLVGWLTSHDGREYRHDRHIKIASYVTTRNPFESGEEGEAIEELVVALVRRHRRIDNMELRAADNPTLMPWDVAFYAEGRVDAAVDATTYTWPIAVVDLDQYERLFDLDTFEPIEAGEPDRDTPRLQEAIEAATKSVTKSFDEDLLNSMMGGGLTSTLTAASERKSTLTADMVKDMVKDITGLPKPYYADSAKLYAEYAFESAKLETELRLRDDYNLRIYPRAMTGIKLDVV
jgi:hypothetical protein